MASLHEIIAFTDSYLDTGSIKDYCPQGLQAEGRGEVGKIVSGVSACAALFGEAVKRKADAVLVHHGMFWDSEPRVLKGSLKERVKLLLENDLSLIAYHLPLDRHPVSGNNIQLVKRLGLVDAEPFGDYHGKSIGYAAKTAAPVKIAAFMETVKEKINPAARFHAFGPGEIKSVAICSGAAPELVREAIERRADMFITGEEPEWIYHLAREEKIHYVAAGHHATERFGVMALGEVISEKFGVPVEFVDIPNPI
ncbi:MAG: Nif3-like dinuclear metal center hexameric protein [Nitrospinae bacterium]|nr:Nif3-like dinuclear metal center hexameric protein [Nitrospinota bacterium]